MDTTNEPNMSASPSTRNQVLFYGCTIGCCLTLLWIAMHLFGSGKTDDVLSSLTAKDHVLLEQLVDDRINHFFAVQQQKLIDQKLSKYALASNSNSSPKPIYGNEQARFTLVEFSDLECPYCKRYHGIPKEVVDKSNGLVNWEWVHMPLEFHNPAAKVLAHVSECVRDVTGNQAFWAFLDEVFRESAGNGQGVPSITKLIADVGGDPKSVSDCVNGGSHLAKLKMQLARAEQMNVTSTPTTFVVDNQTGKYIQLKGAVPASSLEQTIEALIQQSQQVSSNP